MSVAWSAFLNKIRLDVPGCPDPVIELAAKLTAIDFFRKSKTWRVENVTLLTTVANQRDYAVTNPSNTALAAICSAWSGLDEIDVGLPGESDDDAHSDAAGCWRVDLKNSSTIRVSPAPNYAGAVIKGTVAYAPTESATGIDDELYYLYRDALELGAKAMLKLQANKPWTDLGVGAAAMSAYDARTLEHSSAAGPIRRRRMRVKQWG